MKDSEYIVISLGGSLIVPNEIDVEFLKAFISLLTGYIQKGLRFVIITGGGRISRTYTLAAKDIENPSNTDLDLIGIAVTRLNAEFIRVLFGEYSCPEILFNPEIAPQTDKPIIVGGGWKPGNSSDLAAVVAAKTVGARSIINLSNIEYVYDKDPRYNADAVKIEAASWKDFRALLPKDWDPGLNAPFDPVAAEQAESLGLKVMIMNGKNIENLKDCLDGKSFIGSIIQ